MTDWLKSLFRREPTRRFYTVVFYNPRETYTRESVGGEITVCAPAHLERYLADSQQTAEAMFRSDNPHCVPISISYWQ